MRIVHLPRWIFDQRSLVGRSSADASAVRPGALLVIVPSVVVLLPVLALALAWLQFDPSVWSHLWDTLLPEMVINTIALIAGTGALTLTIGTSLAWLVTNYRFPGVRVMEWLLVLPLAIPGYILGFVFMSLFDYAGPIQTTLRAWLGDGLELPEIRSLPGAVVVLSLTLYPYVYLMARTAFREQSVAQHEAARAMGLNDAGIFLRLAIPVARPALAAGATLVMMEALTDFAVVRYFNTVTLSEGIVRLWVGQMDRDSAVQLAFVLLLIALTILLVERWMRRGARYDQIGGDAPPITPRPLHGRRAVAALVGSLAIFGLAFVLPCAQLAVWAVGEVLAAAPGTLDAVFGQYLMNTLGLSLGAALLVILVAVPMAYTLRFLDGQAGSPLRGLARAATFGYAIPGAVVALGVLLLLASLNSPVAELTGNAVLLSASLIGLMYGYLVRFLAIGFNSAESSLENVTPDMERAARSLGATPVRVFRHVYLPLIRGGVMVGLLLVFVDVLKELPLTMFLRPFGMETLSVWTYMLASESAWEGAAVPALVIVLASVSPALVLMRLSNRAARRRKAADHKPLS